jgi:hypothetical protein
MPLSMMWGGDRRLHQRLAFGADPLAADVTLHGEDARGVVELLADVLADALHRAAALARRAVGFVVDVVTRQVSGQRGTLRLALVAVGLLGLCVLDLARHRRQVHVQRLFEQASLIGGVGLALGGELQPLERGVLVREFVDKGLREQQCLVLASHLGERRAQCAAQLFGVERVDRGISDHGY